MKQHDAPLTLEEAVEMATSQQITQPYGATQAPAMPQASTAAIAWGAVRSGQSIWEYIIGMTREFEAKLQAEYEAWKAKNAWYPANRKPACPITADQREAMPTGRASEEAAVLTVDDFPVPMKEDHAVPAVKASVPTGEDFHTTAEKAPATTTAGASAPTADVSAPTVDGSPISIVEPSALTGEDFHTNAEEAPATTTAEVPEPTVGDLPAPAVETPVEPAVEIPAESVVETPAESAVEAPVLPTAKSTTPKRKKPTKRVATELVGKELKAAITSLPKEPDETLYRSILDTTDKETLIGALSELIEKRKRIHRPRSAQMTFLKWLEDQA